MAPPNYDDRLRETGLVSKQARRLATVLTFAYKCIHRLVDVDHHELGLELTSNATRSNGVNLNVHMIKLCWKSTQLKNFA